MSVGLFIPLWGKLAQNESQRLSAPTPCHGWHFMAKLARQARLITLAALACVCMCVDVPDCGALACQEWPLISWLVGQQKLFPFSTLFPAQPPLPKMFKQARKENIVADSGSDPSAGVSLTYRLIMYRLKKTKQKQAKSLCSCTDPSSEVVKIALTCSQILRSFTSSWIFNWKPNIFLWLPQQPRMEASCVAGWGTLWGPWMPIQGHLRTKTRPTPQ